MDNNYKDRLEVVSLQGKELAILGIILHLQEELRKIKVERIKLEKVQ